MPSSLEKRPNILLIIMDATRADHLSCYGYGRQTSPNIDRLAANGVLYEQAISPAAWTLESFPSLFTGLYPSQHGTNIFHQYLDPRFKTMAEVLRDQGYQTALFSPGGWISTTFGFERGFETFRNYMYQNRLMRRFFKKTTRVEKVLRRVDDIWHGPSRGKLTHAVAHGVRTWFQTERHPDQPYFAVAHFLHPQFSFDGGRRGGPRRYAPNGTKHITGEQPLPEAELRLLQDYYDGEIAFLDHYIGQMLKQLRASGHLDNTIVIVTADHGEHLGEHHLLGHNMSVYEDLLRVPLVISHPDFFSGGQRVSEAVQSIDFLVTFLELLDIPRSAVSNPLPGRSLLPDKVRADPRPFTYSEFLSTKMRRFQRLGPGVDASHFERTLRALRMRESGYKFISGSDGRHELYDLKQDAAERTNLAEREPATVQALQNQLDSWLATLQVTALENLQPEMDSVVADRLRDLGYLE